MRVMGKVKEFDTWNKWRINNKAILKANKSTREHVLKIVDKSDKHPVRFGKQSLKFEVRNWRKFMGSIR